MNKKYKIGILDYSGIVTGGTSSTTILELRALKDTIKKYGAIPVIYNVSKLQIVFGDSDVGFKYNYRRFKMPDFLIPKVSIVGFLDSEITFLRQFELAGVPVVNDYLSIKRAKNKLRTAQLLSEKGLPIPDTIVVRDLRFIDKAIERVGGYPVILKTPFGTYGAGVVLVESRRSLLSALSNAVFKDDILLIQRYVKEANGKDYRVFVLGDKIVGTMERTAKDGDFRSNLHLGGVASLVDLTEEEKRVAVDSAKALGLRMAGVDLLRSNDGPVVMEVNGNPGFAGLSAVTGIDIADEVIKYVVGLLDGK